MKAVPLRIRLAVAWSVLFCTVLPALAQDTADRRASVLASVVREAFQYPGLQSGFQGVLIQSLDDGSVWHERNADNTFLPASNNKLLTSAVALAVLGRDFTYKTRLLRRGEIAPDGTLRGDLLLIGSGDPLLMPDHLRDMARAVRAAGIRRIVGRVAYDDSLFDTMRLGEGWSWDDEPFYYSAQVSALNLNRNMIFVQPRPGKKKGDPIRLTVGPTASYARIVNTALTAGSGSKPNLKFDRIRGQNVIVVSGTLPPDAGEATPEPTGVTIEDPSRYTASVLTEYLKQNGVSVTSEPERSRIGSATFPVVAERVSEPLSVYLSRLNKPSDNLVAECLLKTVGALRQHIGSGGAEGTGAKAAREELLRLGLDVERLRMADGSGLSRNNYVTPRNLVKLLTQLAAQQDDYSAFYASLPIAGVDGTLRNQMKNTPAEGNCRAKTGSLSQVSCLSGYVTTKDGERLVFSILMNNHLAPNSVARAAQNRIVAFLAGWSRNDSHVSKHTP